MSRAILTDEEILNAFSTRSLGRYTYEVQYKPLIEGYDEDSFLRLTADSMEQATRISVEYGARIINMRAYRISRVRK